MSVSDDAVSNDAVPAATDVAKEDETTEAMIDAEEEGDPMSKRTETFVDPDNESSDEKRTDGIRKDAVGTEDKRNDVGVDNAEKSQNKEMPDVTATDDVTKESSSSLGALCDERKNRRTRRCDRCTPC